MYDNDFRISDRQANATRSFVESAINRYEESNNYRPNNNYRTRFQEDAELVIANTAVRDNNINKYRCFVESMKSSLLIEALYNIFENSFEGEKNYTNTSIMRAMIGQYVKENGYDNILNKMKTASVTLSEMYNVILNTSNTILESVDKDDPNSLTINSDIKDDFFKALNYNDSEDISNAIKERVSTAMDDFITANTKDHEDIESVLKDAQEKIDAAPEEDTELRESYDILAKRKVCEIRNSPKNILHAMVSSMCESVMRNQNDNKEFLIEGKLDVNKIVDRVKIMYTFIEMLNTSRLEKIDEVYIESVINDLKK